jgi:hypothetical protein
MNIVQGIKRMIQGTKSVIGCLIAIVGALVLIGIFFNFFDIGWREVLFIAVMLFALFPLWEINDKLSKLNDILLERWQLEEKMKDKWKDKKEDDNKEQN